MKLNLRTASLCCLALCTLAAPGIAQETKEAKAPEFLNAAHILIAYEGASRSKATRTKEEAKALATQVAAEAKKPGADFAALAGKHSDGPSKVNGGDLGKFKPAQMVPAFSRATLKLKVGEVSGPVESDFGYHIILRKAIPEDLNAAHILIGWKGAERSKATRSKEEALKLATEISKQAQAAGADFAAMAKKHSDGPSGPRGGDLGVFPPGQMVPAFSKATQKLKVGQVSGPVESPFGYHVILRKALPKKASAKHILVQWKGSMRADANITRTKEEAMKRLNECIAKLKAGGKFEELAKEYSDGPSGPRGGDLGEFGQGQMVKEFDETLFKMKSGETSGVVETQFGYHIIYRYK
ncbi:MAG: peptidylprolyl isomerase [Planctomycetaceae bacterium]